MTPTPEEDLGKRFKELETSIRQSVQFAGGTDSRGMLGIALLGQAIVKLDRTSTRLAVANVVLAVILAAIGGVQIFLMVRGH
jgi:hypothetical protein